MPIQHPNADLQLVINQLLSCKEIIADLLLRHYSVNRGHLHVKGQTVHTGVLWRQSRLYKWLIQPECSDEYNVLMDFDKEFVRQIGDNLRMFDRALGKLVPSTTHWNEEDKTKRNVVVEGNPEPLVALLTNAPNIVAFLKEKLPTLLNVSRKYTEYLETNKIGTMSTACNREQDLENTISRLKSLLRLPLVSSTERLNLNEILNRHKADLSVLRNQGVASSSSHVALNNEPEQTSGQLIDAAIAQRLARQQQRARYHRYRVVVPSSSPLMPRRSSALQPVNPTPRRDTKAQKWMKKRLGLK